MKAEYIKDADALSREPNLKPEDETAKQEIKFYFRSIAKNIHASQPLLNEIKNETINNSALSKLKDLIVIG